MRVAAPTDPKFPLALRKGPEDGRMAHTIGNPSLPDGRMDSLPLLGPGTDFDLGTCQVGMGIDDGGSDPFSDVNDHCALAGAGRLLSDGVVVKVRRRRRHDAMLGALYPLCGTPKYGKPER